VTTPWENARKGARQKTSCAFQQASKPRSRTAPQVLQADNRAALRARFDQVGAESLKTVTNLLYDFAQAGLRFDTL
jgi:hypothetical protein